MHGKYTIDKTLDVRGLQCPVPTVMTGNTLKEMKEGNVLQVVTNDMTTSETIPALCKQEGYNLIDVQEKDGLFYFFIRR